MAKNDGNVLYDRILGGIFYGLGIPILIAIILNLLLAGLLRHDFSSFRSIHNFSVFIKPWVELGIFLMVIVFLFNNTKKSYQKGSGSGWGFRTLVWQSFIFFECIYIVGLLVWFPQELKTFSDYLYGSITPIILSLFYSTITVIFLKIRKK
jgi:hypothetical protein